MNDLRVLLGTRDEDPEYLYRSRLITVILGIINVTRLNIFENMYMSEERQPSEFLNYFYAQLEQLSGTLRAYQGIMREIQNLD